MLEEHVNKQVLTIAGARHRVVVQMAEHNLTLARIVVQRLAGARALLAHISNPATRAATEAMLDSAERGIETMVVRIDSMQDELKKRMQETAALDKDIKAKRVELSLHSTASIFGANARLQREINLVKQLNALLERKATVTTLMMDQHEDIARLRQQVWQSQKEAFDEVERFLFRDPVVEAEPTISGDHAAGEHPLLLTSDTDTSRQTDVIEGEGSVVIRAGESAGANSFTKVA